MAERLGKRKNLNESLLVCAAVGAAQDRTQSARDMAIQMETKPTNCEFHIATLDAAHHEAGKDGLVIVIVRLGDGEHRQDLNRRRLHNFKTYLLSSRTDLQQRSSLQQGTA